jgi:hypothetical protein
MNKININKINKKISSEFPNTKIIICDNRVGSFEIYYNNSKSIKKNNFNILDGGTKDRIIRRVKLLLSNKEYVLKNNKNIFIIFNKKN